MVWSSLWEPILAFMLTLISAWACGAQRSSALSVLKGRKLSWTFPHTQSVSRALGNRYLFHNCGWNDPWWKIQTARILRSYVPTGGFGWPALGTHNWKLWLLLEVGLNSVVTGLDPSVTYIPYVASCLFTFVVPEPDVCVYSHIPFSCCLFSLTYIPRVEKLYYCCFTIIPSLVSQSSLACLLHCSVSAVCSPHALWVPPSHVICF